MAADLTVAELVDLGDLDELIRRIDRLCDEADWDSLLRLRDLSRAAFERGRQLWPAASHAEYRLALQAPGRWAATVVQPGAARFALGPLSEVAASTHTWGELAPHLPSAAEAAVAAQERVLRGEDLRGDPVADRETAELPLVLQAWEPAYPLAIYKPCTAEFGDVPAPAMSPVELPPAAPQVDDDPDAARALADLVTPWTSQSGGEVAVAAVEGDAWGAVAALAPSVPFVRGAAVGLAHALGLMAWTAASGGAHGRRRGMALGRFSAWWAAAALADALDGWPDIGTAIGELRWYRWERVEPSTGWVLRLAAEHPADGRAWAIEARDSRQA